MHRGSWARLSTILFMHIWDLGTMDFSDPIVCTSSIYSMHSIIFRIIPNEDTLKQIEV